MNSIKKSIKSRALRRKTQTQNGVTSPSRVTKLAHNA